MRKSNQAAPPSIAATREAIADEVVREGIVLYHKARGACARFEGAAAGDAALDGVLQVLTDRMLAAETHLVRAILARSDRRVYCRPEKHLYPSCGVRCDGRLYLVRPDVGDAEFYAIGESKAGVDMMHLTVVDEANIADVGTPGDEEDGDDDDR